VQKLAERSAEEFDAGLADDLNTAQALAAVFELVREANIAMDRGELRQEDVAPVKAVLDKFDRVFALIKDDDAARLAELGLGAPASGPSDTEIEVLVAQRQAARKRRDFAEADRIRRQLAEGGILIEDTRDGGARWRRK
jgi:cysteinyl-tRNA synthetase